MIHLQKNPPIIVETFARVSFRLWTIEKKTLIYSVKPLQLLYTRIILIR
tara:strand:- start:227 stop:373 length:147 start_codon:yes stop_codon:yes gene_type:complete